MIKIMRFLVIVITILFLWNDEAKAQFEQKFPKPDVSSSGIVKKRKMFADQLKKATLVIFKINANENQPENILFNAFVKGWKFFI